MNERDDLLKRAERLKREQNASAEAQKAAARPWFIRMFTGLYERSSLVKNVTDTLSVIWNYWLKPLALIINPLVNLYMRLMRWVFTKFSFVNGEYDKYRGAFAALVLVVFTGFFGWTVVTRGVPLVIDFTYDAVTINLFSHKETMIFSQPQNVEGSPELLRVYACRVYPCEGQTDSVEYRMRDSIYLDMVRLVTRFEPHDPGELAGAFVSEENACNINAYGVRNKWLGWYPYITAATCRPINGENYDEILEQMRSLAQK